MTMPRGFEKFKSFLKEDALAYELDDSQTTTIAASAASGFNLSTSSSSNSHNQHKTRGIRIMVWNIQDFGGGPSRGPERDDFHIYRIAAILQEVSPDVLVILELKLAPPKPQPAAASASTSMRLRSGSDAAATRQDRVKDTAKEKFERYKARLDKWRISTQALQASGLSSGQSELARLMASSAWNVPDQYDLLATEHTNGEFYGFLIRKGIFDKPEPRLLGDSSSYRQAALLELTFLNKKWGGPERIDLLALHAPSPKHGQATHDAIKMMAINYEKSRRGEAPCTVTAADSNVNTAAERQVDQDKARDTITDFEQAIASHGDIRDEKLKFTSSLDMQGIDTNAREPHAGRWVGTWILDVPVPHMNSLGASFSGSYHPAHGKTQEGSVYYQNIQSDDPSTLAFFRQLNEAEETSTASADPGVKTTLRRSSKAALKARQQKVACLDDFEFSAYDVLTCQDRSFVQEFRYKYPLLDRVTPSSLPYAGRRMSAALQQRIDDEYALRLLNKKQARIPLDHQSILDEANALSDHVPLITDLFWGGDRLNCICTDGLLSGNRGATAQVGNEGEEAESDSLGEELSFFQNFQSQLQADVPADNETTSADSSFVDEDEPKKPRAASRKRTSSKKK